MNTLERRRGYRLHCRARVRWSAESGVSGSGRIRDISASGAFIETTVEVPLEARLTLVILGNESAAGVVERAAIVVRVAPDGMGVEWYGATACSICADIGCDVPCEEPGE